VVKSKSSEGSSEETTEDTSMRHVAPSEINNEERGDSVHVRQINIGKECRIQRSVAAGGGSRQKACTRALLGSLPYKT